MFTNDIDIKRVRNEPISFNIKAFVVVFVKVYVSSALQILILCWKSCLFVNAEFAGTTKLEIREPVEQ